MMLIKDFKIKKRLKHTNKSHSDAISSIIVIVSYCDMFQRDIEGQLNLLENSIKQSIGYNYKNAKHPLFEHDRGDASICAAIIVGLGCNTLPKDQR